MKVYVCSVTVYDLLLGLGWQKRVQMKIDMGKGTMSIPGTDGKERMVQTNLAPGDLLTRVSFRCFVLYEIFSLIQFGNHGDERHKKELVFFKELRLLNWNFSSTISTSTLLAGCLTYSDI
jgi:hypothetical protein